jgi:hypothetical protein
MSDFKKNRTICIFSIIVVGAEVLVQNLFISKIIVIDYVLEYTGHTKFIDSMSYDEEMPSSNLSQGMCYM